MNKSKYAATAACAVIACIFASLSSGVAKESDKQSRASLVAIKGVGVIVEDLAPDAEQESFSTQLIQTDVEQKLRAAGITVLAEEELAKAPGIPYLYVNIFTFREAELYTYHITLELKQMVALIRKPGVKQSAATWKISSGGTVGAMKLRELRAFVKDDVDRFISAWKAANK
jgi:hypothetical protein